MVLEHARPTSKGVTTLMYVGDVDAPPATGKKVALAVGVALLLWWVIRAR